MVLVNFLKNHYIDDDMEKEEKNELLAENYEIGAVIDQIAKYMCMVIYFFSFTNIIR